jgi:hypothetical protein
MPARGRAYGVLRCPARWHSRRLKWRVDPPVATSLLPKVVTVFRRRVSTWESEALVHVEILRAVLDSLTELKSSIDQGDPSASAVVLDNSSQVTTRSGVWLTEWKNRCIDKGVTEAAAFEAYATCLPALAHCVDVYQWSLRILAISRDVDSGDGELAARGINTAHAVALFTLHCLEDAPTLRLSDRRMTQAALETLSVQMRPLVALGGDIHDVVAQLQRDAGVDA